MGLRPGLSSAVPVRQAQGRLCGTRFGDGRPHADSLAPEARFSRRAPLSITTQCGAVAGGALCCGCCCPLAGALLGCTGVLVTSCPSKISLTVERNCL